MVSKKKKYLLVVFSILFIVITFFFIFNSKQDSFSVKTFLLKSNVPFGGEFSHKVNIENKENVAREFNVYIDGLNNMVSLSENNFIIGPKEEKEITIYFKDTKSEVAIYSGELIVSNKFMNKDIPIIITVEDESDVLSIIHEELQGYSGVYPGGKLGLNIRVYDLNDLPVPTVESKFYVQNLKGDLLWSTEQDLIVGGSKTEVINIPKNWPKGDYLFVTVADYKGIKSVSSYIFSLSEKSYNFLQNFNAKLLILIGLIFFLGFLILFFYLMKSRDEFLKAFRKQQKEELANNFGVIKCARKEIKESKIIPVQKKKKLKKLKKVEKRIVEKIKKKQKAQRKEFKNLRKKKKKKSEIQGKFDEWKKQGYKMQETSEEMKFSKQEMKNKLKLLKEQGYKF